MVARAATESARVTNDPILIPSSKGSDAKGLMPISLLSKKKKAGADPNDGMAQIETS